MASTHAVRIARAYDEPGQGDGARVLVDRLWPRGMSKQKVQLDRWCTAVAPSTQLRTWYAHDPDRFAEFRRRYRAELDDPERAEALEQLRDLARERTLTLITATKHPEISAAAVLAELLRG